MSLFHPVAGPHVTPDIQVWMEKGSVMSLFHPVAGPRVTPDIQVWMEKVQ
jgi:hypothetical protein